MRSHQSESKAEALCLSSHLMTYMQALRKDACIIKAKCFLCPEQTRPGQMKGYFKHGLTWLAWLRCTDHMMCCKACLCCAAAQLRWVMSTLPHVYHG